MKVYLYVLNTLADWEIAYITAEMTSGRFFRKGQAPLSITRISHSMEPVKTMGGIELTVNALFSETVFESGDILLLPGADTWLDDVHQPALKAIDGLLEKGVVVAAICGATLGMAAAGLLNSRKHTSNDGGYLKECFPAYTGGQLFLEEPVAVDGNLITATGLAPLEFSREVFLRSGLFREATVNAWYDLHSTRKAECFYELMNSLG
jgi:putative intracellular protease/amidase